MCSAENAGSRRIAVASKEYAAFCSRNEVRRSRRPLKSTVELLELRTLLSNQAITINDVQPDAVAMPEIHGILQTSPGGVPLEGEDASGNPGYYDIEGFLDTGTSGVLIDSDFVSQAAVPQESYNGQLVNYNDTGIAGSVGEGVSPPLTVSLATSNADNDTSGNGLGLTDNSPPELSQYTQSFNNLQIQLSRDAVDPDIGAIDIFGMPTLQGKVAVIDPTPTDNLNTPSDYIYNPGTPFNSTTATTNPGIPTTNLHVKLTYASFNQFSTVTPVGAPGPMEDDNPFIGPNPLNALSAQHSFDNTPPVSMTMGTDKATGSFLFDTGAASSFISQAVAAKLGVFYLPGTYNTADADLVDGDGNDLPNQFQETIGGVGGAVTVAGFFMDSLTIPTIEGPSITFLNAPVLVTDVTVTNPSTQQSLTLDGDFGANFLLASINLADINLGFARPTGVSPAQSNLGQTSSPFDWITFDQPNGILGLDLPGTTITPWPTATASDSNLTSGGGTNYTFTVNYAATTGQTITAATIGNNNILVTGPHGFSQLATELNVNQPGNGSARTVTYNINAPAGGWSTANDGDYIINMQPNQVQDSASDSVRGQALAAFSIAIAPAAIPSTSGADTYYFEVDPASVYTEVFVNTPSTGDPTYLYSPTALSPLTINGGGGNDAVTFDFSNGNPLPTAGASFDGGTGINSLTIIGGGGNDSITVDGSQVNFGNEPINYANTQSIVVSTGAGNDTLEQLAQPNASLTYNGEGQNTLIVDAGSYTFSGAPTVDTSNISVFDYSSVIFSAASPGAGITAQTLAALNLGPSATATLLNPASHNDRTVLVLGNLTESSTSTLNLGSNDMIVQDGILANLTAKIKSGLNLSHNGYWNGPGITSSTAAASKNTALGIELNSNGSGGTLVSTFDGQGVSSSAVLIKYTYYGDANLDGKVNASDYALLDNGLNMGLTGWQNGDFNYDGLINGDDYTLADNAYNTQGSVSLAAIPATPPATNAAQTASLMAVSIPDNSSSDESTELKKGRSALLDLLDEQ